MKPRTQGLWLDGLSFSKLMFWSSRKVMLCALLALIPMGCQQADHVSRLPVDTESLALLRRFRLNASLGDAHAPNNLGEFYLKGEGVAKNEIEAYAYFNLPRACAHAEANRQRLGAKLSSEDRLRGQQRTKELQKELERWQDLQKEIDGVR